MNLIRIQTETLPVFQTTDHKNLPKQFNVQYQNGDLSMLWDLPHSGLAIVGTRHPQKRSLDLLEETLVSLRNTRLIIVSGFARGIDAKAHELAIKLGLRTIAVLGSGINLTYPRENQALRQSILDSGGLVISQFDDNAEAYASNFYKRNLVIAAITRATWVVEAAQVSGTLNTANHASTLNRDLYATSCFPTDQFYQGNLKLLSGRNPLKLPVAKPFYSAESLSDTWAELGALGAQRDLQLNLKPRTQIQTWVCQIQSSAGECRVQTLMNFASEKGYTLGKFYQDFEAEVGLGLIRYDTAGLVEICS